MSPFDKGQRERVGAGSCPGRAVAVLFLFQVFACAKLNKWGKPNKVTAAITNTRCYAKTTQESVVPDLSPL